MKYILACTFLLTPAVISASFAPEIIGKAEFCAVSKQEVWCVSHTFNACLGVLWDLKDGRECVPNKGQF